MVGWRSLGRLQVYLPRTGRNKILREGRRVARVRSGGGKALNHLVRVWREVASKKLPSLKRKGRGGPKGGRAFVVEAKIFSGVWVHKILRIHYGSSEEVQSRVAFTTTFTASLLFILSNAFWKSLIGNSSVMMPLTFTLPESR